MRFSSYETDFTLDLGDLGEQTCHVDFRYAPGRLGTWYRKNGDPGDQPKLPELDITRVTCLGCDITELAVDFLYNSDPFMDRAAGTYEAANMQEEA